MRVSTNIEDILNDDDNESTPKGKNDFPVTRWGMIADSADPESIVRMKAQKELYQTYWPPLYGYARMKGKSEEDAEDLLQGFFSKQLSNESFNRADETKGKFRTFLLTAFNHFMRDEWQKQQSQKRGGGVEVISIDRDEGERIYELTDHKNLTPEEAYQQNWARTVLENSIERLRKSYQKKGNMDQFKALAPFLGLSEEPNYHEAATKLNLPIKAARVSVHRFRKKFRNTIRAEIADTLPPGADITEEMRNLMTAFSPKQAH